MSRFQIVRAASEKEVNLPNAVQKSIVPKKTRKAFLPCSVSGLIAHLQVVVLNAAEGVQRSVECRQDENLVIPIAP